MANEFAGLQSSKAHQSRTPYLQLCECASLNVTVLKIKYRLFSPAPEDMVFRKLGLPRRIVRERVLPFVQNAHVRDKNVLSSSSDELQCIYFDTRDA